MLEAQVNGLPILTLDRVSENEIKINNNFVSLSLDDSTKKWVEQIVEIKTNSHRLNYESIKSDFNKAGYNIKYASVKLRRMFLK